MVHSFTQAGTPGGQVAYAGSMWINTNTGIIYIQTVAPFGSTWSLLDTSAGTDSKNDISDIYTAVDTFNAKPVFNSGATFNNMAPTFNIAPTLNVVPVFNSGATFNNTAPTFNAGATFANHVVEQTGTTSFSNNNQICQMYITGGLSLAPFDQANITLTNSLVNVNSACFATLFNYGGNASPIVNRVSPGAGFAVISIYNMHSATTVTTDFEINFIVF